MRPSGMPRPMVSRHLHKERPEVRPSGMPRPMVSRHLQCKRS